MKTYSFYSNYRMPCSISLELMELLYKMFPEADRNELRNVSGLKSGECMCLPTAKNSMALLPFWIPGYWNGTGQYDFLHPAFLYT